MVRAIIAFLHEKSPCGPCFEFESSMPSLFEPGVYFHIKCIGKSPGPTNEFERSLVFETSDQSSTVNIKLFCFLKYILYIFNIYNKM